MLSVVKQRGRRLGEEIQVPQSAPSGNHLAENPPRISNIQVMPHQTIYNSDFGVVFFTMLVVFLLSLFYPINPNLPFAKAIALSPIALVPLWWLYEQLMPSHMNIRVDLFIIIPMLLISAVILVLRLPWLLRTRNISPP